MSRPQQINWEYGASLNEGNRSYYLGRKQDFVDWLGSEILVKNSTESCSNALQIFPLTQGSPSYKSDYHLASEIFNGWNRYSISQLGQVPEVVVPIGQVPYLSKLTNTTKYLPVSISIQAAAGAFVSEYWSILLTLSFRMRLYAIRSPHCSR